MEKKVLTTPLRAEDLEDIHAGDIIYLSGHIVTCRDVAHRRLIEEGRKLPVDVRGGAIFHAGPIVRPIPGSDDRFEMVSVGPTTSMRMEKFEKEFIEETGVRVIVGKGGMEKDTLAACEKYGYVYLQAAPGCAAKLAQGIKGIQDVTWFEMGMPEALWDLEAVEFGPLVVGMDTHGNSIYKNLKEAAFKKLDEIYPA